MSTTEERIAAALTAHAGGITMDSSTMEQRFAEVQERGVQDRRRRRRTAVGAAALAAAAAVAAVLTLGGGVLTDEAAPPPMADRVDTAPRPAQQDVVVTGEVFPEPGTSYVVQAFAVPYRFQVPERDGVPGRWRIGPPQADDTSVGLDDSPSTGHASVAVEVVDRAYRPDVPWTEQTDLIAAPQDADGWAAWYAATGFATVSDRQAVQVAGLPAERMLVTVADDLPEAYDGCSPSAGCLATRPHGQTPGSGNQAGPFEGTVVELTVLEAAGRTLLVSASGDASSKDLWLPLMREVVDSIELL